MLLDLKLPTIVPAMSTALIEVIYVSAGAELKPGDKILDLTIDLGSAFSQDCPPISHYRLVARERARLRDLAITVGGHCAPGEPIARLSTDEADPAEGGAVRSLRIAVVGILGHAAMVSWARAG
jgi:hypothetical protein